MPVLRCQSLDSSNKREYSALITKHMTPEYQTEVLISKSAIVLSDSSYVYPSSFNLLYQ